MQKKGLSDNVVALLTLLVAFAVVAVMGIRKSRQHERRAQQLQTVNDSLQLELDRLQQVDR